MRVLHKLARRLRVLLAPGSIERDFDDEMGHHLREAARELEGQGYSPAAAAAEARRRFGGLALTRDQARDAWGGRVLRDLSADVRSALHQMARAPLHAGAVVLLLGAAGAGATIALTLARAWLIRPLPYPESDRLVTVLAAPSRERFDLIPDLSAVDWEPATRLFEQTAAWDLDGFTLVGPGGPPEYLAGAWVSAGFFDLLGIQPARGRGFHPAEYVPGSNVAILSDGLWRRRYGADPAVIGSSVRMHSTDRPDQDALVTIVGVLPPRAWDLHRFTDVLRPLSGPRMFSLARLPSGVNREEATARFNAVVRPQVPSADSAWHMRLTSTQAEYTVEIRPVLLVLTGAALLLLILAQASTGALLLARATARIRELDVRRALGATRGRLIRQLGTEALVLCAVALLLGLALTPALIGMATRGMETFGRIAVPGGSASVGLDPPVVLAVIAMMVLPYFALAVSPVLRLAIQTAAGAPGRATPTRSVARMRRGLVALQVAVAVVLLAQGALLAQTVRIMLHSELGFEDTSLLKALVLLPRTQYPDAATRREAVAAMVARVRQLPEVVDAAIASPHPFRQAGTAPVQCDGCDAATAYHAMETIVTPGYFETMAIPLRFGRLFDQRDDSTGAAAIISETLSRRLWNTADGTGRRLRRASDQPGPWLTVVGVVGDVRKNFSDSLIPDLYRPYDQVPRAFASVMVRTRTPPLMAESRIREAVAAADPALALAEVEPMDLVVRDRQGPARVLAGFVGGAALLGFGLAVLGLAAVVSYLVRLRRREFAVRVTLGARPGQIVDRVFRDGAGMLLTGLGLGLAGAWAVAGASRSVLSGVSPRDPLVYVMVSGLVLLVAALALAVPAGQAARVDPALSLRDE